jgi:undecaprenyl diphosphate synthase
VERLPANVREVLDPLIEESASHTGMNLTLALSYGGREEIVDAARAIAARVEMGALSTHDIDLGTVDAALQSTFAGPVDLLIRTGGEQRISNFLLWSAAYAELYFSTTLWPDYGEADLYDAVSEYQKRHRRFGRVESSTVEPPLVPTVPQKNVAL